MNIAQTLHKPKVTRGMRRRRIRRVKFIFHLFVCLVCLSSAAYAFYWTLVGMIHIAGIWVTPRINEGWQWLTQLSSHEWFAMFNRLTWVAAAVGTIVSVGLLFRPTRWVRWVVSTCSVCCYAFLTYALWLVLRSFWHIPHWVSYAYTFAAMIVLTVSYCRFQRCVTRETAEETA